MENYTNLSKSLNEEIRKTKNQINNIENKLQKEEKIQYDTMVMSQLLSEHHSPFIVATLFLLITSIGIGTLMLPINVLTLVLSFLLETTLIYFIGNEIYKIVETQKILKGTNYTYKDSNSLYNESLSSLINISNLKCELHYLKNHLDECNNFLQEVSIPKESKNNVENFENIVDERIDYCKVTFSNEYDIDKKLVKKLR